MTDLTKHMSGKSSSATTNTTTTQHHSRATMPATSTSQRPTPFGVLPPNSIGPFPGLIPGLAGSLPGQKPANGESTDERLKRLESLAADQAQEIYSLRWSSSASREEADGLRIRIAELEARLSGRLSAIKPTPVSVNYSRTDPAVVSINYPHMDSAPIQSMRETLASHQQRSRFGTFLEQKAAASAASASTRTTDKEATPVPQVKRSRYAALFERMAAESANKATISGDSHGKEVEAVPVLDSTPSTAVAAHSDKIVTPPTPTRGDSYGGIKVHDDPFPWGGRFGQPDFNFAAPALMTSVFAPVPQFQQFPQYKEVDVYGWPLTPHVQEMEEDADPFPWGRGFHGQPDFDLAAKFSASSASTAVDPHCKEMQACGKLHAPRPIRPRAPLLNRIDF